MLGLTLASLRARPLRALLTAFSIVLGVAMISGTFVVTGQINRAFSEIFDAVNVKNDVVIELRTVSDDNSGFQEPFSGLRAEPCPQGARRRRDDRRDRRARLAGHLQERQAQARQLRRRRPSARVLDAAGALRPGEIRAGPPRHGRRRDRADRGHRQEGQGRCRRDGRTGHAGRAQAPARRRHLPHRHDGLARRSAHQLDPAQGRPALVLAGRAVHPGQRPDGAGRLQDDAARPHPRAPRQPLQGANRLGEGQGRLAGHRGPDQRLPRPGAARIRRRGGARRRLHHLQHVLDHGGAAHPRDRDAAHARREPQADPHERAARGAHDRPARHDHRHLRGAPDRARHQRAVRRGGVRPAVDLAPARDHGRRARARRGTRRDAVLGADSRRARDQDPAHGRACARARRCRAGASRAGRPSSRASSRSPARR